MAEKYVSELTGEELDYGLTHLKSSVDTAAASATAAEASATEASDAAEAALAYADTAKDRLANAVSAASTAGAAATEAAASKDTAAASATAAKASETAAAASVTAAETSATAAKASETAAATSESNAATSETSAASSANAAAASAEEAAAAVSAAHGVPSGGTAGQVLTKNSNDSYDAVWQDSKAALKIGLCAATLSADGWVQDSEKYTQTATLSAIKSDIQIDENSVFLSGPMCYHTGVQSDDEKLLEVLGFLNAGNAVLDENGSVKITVYEKPGIDIDVIYLMQES